MKLVTKWDLWPLVMWQKIYKEHKIRGERRNKCAIYYAWEQKASPKAKTGTQVCLRNRPIRKSCSFHIDSIENKIEGTLFHEVYIKS